jgi:DNA-binding LacI/PurR family transcriptional regulator
MDRVGGMRKKSVSSPDLVGPLASLTDQQPAAGQALHREITVRLKELIVKGDLVPGLKLPTIRQLATMWKTNYFTVHTALAPLIKQGLLISTPKKGTFVRAKAPPLQCVGIYQARKNWPNDEGAFYSAVLTALYSILHREGLQCMVWMDERPDRKQEDPIGPLQEAIKDGRIQALVAPLVNSQVLEWIQRFPIPHACMTSLTTPGSVTLDTQTMARMAAKQLKDWGCRTAGLIISESTAALNSDRRPFELPPISTTFLDEAQRLGLRIDNAWVKRPPDTPRSMTEMGYHFFHELWNGANRPDGIFVFPDMVARGVLAAASEDRVKIPDDLHMIIHRNVEVEVFSPIPVAALETSTTMVAEGLFRQIQRQVAGKEAPAICLKPVLRTVK